MPRAPAPPGRTWARCSNSLGSWGEAWASQCRAGPWGGERRAGAPQQRQRPARLHQRQRPPRLQQRLLQPAPAAACPPHCRASRSRRWCHCSASASASACAPCQAVSWEGRKPERRGKEGRKLKKKVSRVSRVGARGLLQKEGRGGLEIRTQGAQRCLVSPVCFCSKN